MRGAEILSFAARAICDGGKGSERSFRHVAASSIYRKRCTPV